MEVTPVSGHFRRNVGWRSARTNRVGIGQVDRLSPIDNQNLAKFTDHYIVGLQIAVHDVLVVRKSNRIDDAFEDLQIVLARVAADRLQPRLSANLFHHVKRICMAVCVYRQADIVNRYDIGVFQAASKLSFAKKLVFHS